jgi:hypothetical protein
MKRPHALWGTAPLAVVLFDRGPAASRATHPSDHRARFRAPARPPRRPPDALAGPDGAALQSGRGGRRKAMKSRVSLITRKRGILDRQRYWMGEAGEDPGHPGADA